MILKVFEGHQPRVQAVFQIVHRVSHVVGPVHDLSLQAGAAGALERGAGPNPLEYRDVGFVRTIFGGGSGGSSPRASRATRARADDRVLERRVQGGAGEVEARARDLRLEAGEKAE